MLEARIGSFVKDGKENTATITMGHFCRICGRMRPNEAFSGPGHRIHVCKECHRLPKSVIEKAEIEQEVFGFLDQSRISEKNRKRLETLLEHPDAEIRTLALLVLRMSQTIEGKRRRWSRLREKDRDLYQRCFEFGLTDRPH